MVRITKFKTDPTDHTIGMSILIVKAPNADFDGDSLNVSISVDNKMADHWYSLHPKFNVFQLTEPGKISSNISMPKPVIGAQSSWLEYEGD